MDFTTSCKKREVKRKHNSKFDTFFKLKNSLVFIDMFLQL